MGDLLEGVVGGLSGAIMGGIASWALSAHFNRKMRSQAQIEKLESMIDSIKGLAVAYWQSAGPDKVSEGLIKSRIHELDSKLKRLRNEGVIRSSNATNASARLIELWEEATGGSFETAGRKEDLPKAAAIRRICDDFYNALVQR